jgi:glyceraldehyde 3-phosphate dehydrogenase
MPLSAKDHPFLCQKTVNLPKALGINGLGRIGKMTVWHHSARKAFQSLVINIGRNAGMGIEDIATYLERDSTYGHLTKFLHGYRGGRAIENLNEKTGTMRINGLPVTILRNDRDPEKIQWNDHDVDVVIDCTGAFRDPTDDPLGQKGSLRGHMVNGVEKVILSAPFKTKDPYRPIPEDSFTAIQGINDRDYDPKKHCIISAASCTTTCLAFMMKVILDRLGAEKILGASMVTVHAATSTQKILDSLPSSGSDDLRKNRSIFNNIILTTTGAAQALEHVIPEIKEMGFMAESVRVPLNTGSLIVLTLNIQDDSPENAITKEKINLLYKEAAEGDLSPYVSYSDKQNISSDIIGTAAAVIIEGCETRTRTSSLKVSLSQACRIQGGDIQGSPSTLETPVTQVVLYGWYDNELGSFTNMLGELTLTVAKSLIK